MATSVRTIAGIRPDTIPEDIFARAQPVVLKGLVSRWPSVVAGQESTGALLDYLRSRGRNQDVLAFRGEPGMRGRYFYNDDLSGFNFERVTSTLHALFDQFLLEAGGTQTPYLYMGSTSVSECLPGFRAENDIELRDAVPLVSIWMGNRSRIAAHFDTPDNVACIVAGKRRFTLFPPEQLANLYVGPLDFTPAGQAISLVDFSDPDYTTFPRFRQAQEASQVAELEPGDALYLPSMWWHHVEALGSFNVLINYWWSPSRYASGNPLNALVHALLSIKDLPPEQRRAWRGMFEYYVFGDDGGDFSHIPTGRLGVLGKIDAATARQLRSLLRSKLA
jgi:hypothetical protein